MIEAKTCSRISGRLMAGAALTSIASALAQSPLASEVIGRAQELVAKVEQTQGCDISLHGAPRLDELTSRWLVAYSGVGPACDDMGAALQREGIPDEISFYRRPNDDEVMALIGRMRATVRHGYACQIAFKGEPQFDDETDLWNVRYYASGEQCEDASDELERQGKAFRVAFRRVR
jgi:hypothetical protein